MLFIFLSIVGLSALSTAQDPRQAAILTDARYLAGDGTFGAAYTQEDGVQFKEESDANGDRRGSYSYVDPTGHRRTVHYTAGKNGFQPIGEGIPKVTLPTPPPPEYQPLPQYNPPDYRPPPRSYHFQADQFPREPVFEPRLSRPRAFQPHPTPAPQPHYQARFQSEYQPHYQQEYQPRPRYQPQHQYEVRPQPEVQLEPEYRSHLAYSFASPSKIAAAPHYDEVTTPNPRRFYPPGKLDFTRTPDGFAYNFSKS